MWSACMSIIAIYFWLVVERTVNHLKFTLHISLQINLYKFLYICIRYETPGLVPLGNLSLVYISTKPYFLIFAGVP